MNKKVILIPIMLIVFFSFTGCSNGSKQENTVSKNSTSASKNNSNTSNDSSNTSDNSSNTSNDNSSASSGNQATFGVTAEADSTELQYVQGKYKEVDAAFSLLQDYYINGADAVSSKIVSGEINTGSDSDVNFFKLSPLSDKDKKTLDLNFQQMQNQIGGKIVKVSVNDYQWMYRTGLNDKNNLGLTFDLELTTDKGDKYTNSVLADVYFLNGKLSYGIEP